MGRGPRRPLGLADDRVIPPARHLFNHARRDPSSTKRRATDYLARILRIPKAIRDALGPERTSVDQ